MRERIVNKNEKKFYLVLKHTGALSKRVQYQRESSSSSRYYSLLSCILAVGWHGPARSFSSPKAQRSPTGEILPVQNSWTGNIPKWMNTFTPRYCASGRKLRSFLEWMLFSGYHGVKDRVKCRHACRSFSSQTKTFRYIRAFHFRGGMLGVGMAWRISGNLAESWRQPIGEKDWHNMDMSFEVGLHIPHRIVNVEKRNTAYRE